MRQESEWHSDARRNTFPLRPTARNSTAFPHSSHTGNFCSAGHRIKKKHVGEKTRGLRLYSMDSKLPPNGQFQYVYNCSRLSVYLFPWGEKYNTVFNSNCEYN